jgi:hypothetical protein
MAELCIIRRIPRTNTATQDELVRPPCLGCGRSSGQSGATPPISSVDLRHSAAAPEVDATQLMGATSGYGPAEDLILPPTVGGS